MVGQSDTVFIRQSELASDTLIYKTDTVLFSSPMLRHYLVGTTVLKMSRKNELSKNKGYNLIILKSTDCQKKVGPDVEIKDEVNFVTKSDSLWVAELNIFANCCYSFLGEIEIINDTIMNFVYHGYGTRCFCTCCFGLIYEIERWKDVDDYDIKYFMINEERKSLVRIE